MYMKWNIRRSNLSLLHIIGAEKVLYQIAQILLWTSNLPSPRAYLFICIVLCESKRYNGPDILHFTSMINLQVVVGNSRS